MLPPRRKLRLEYRLRQKEQMDASPFVTEKFPKLKRLNLILQYFDADGITKNADMKCKMNIEHTRSMLVFACPCQECLEGDFDLTEALANAVAKRRKIATGELRCQGTRKRLNLEPGPCHTLLRFEMILDYD
jgi:hypothetical protein